MDDSCDIYENLPNFEVLEQIEKCQEKIKTLELQIQSLESDIEKLCSSLTELKNTKDILSQNVSALYQTAKAEIDRKDRRISELQKTIEKYECERRLKRIYANKRSREHSPAVPKCNPELSYKRIKSAFEERPQNINQSRYKPYVENKYNFVDIDKTQVLSKTTVCGTSSGEYKSASDKKESVDDKVRSKAGTKEGTLKSIKKDKHLQDPSLNEMPNKLNKTRNESNEKTKKDVIVIEKSNVNYSKENLKDPANTSKIIVHKNISLGTHKFDKEMSDISYQSKKESSKSKEKPSNRDNKSLSSKSKDNGNDIINKRLPKDPRLEKKSTSKIYANVESKRKDKGPDSNNPSNVYTDRLKSFEIADTRQTNNTKQKTMNKNQIDENTKKPDRKHKVEELKEIECSSIITPEISIAKKENELPNAPKDPKKYVKNEQNRDEIKSIPSDCASDISQKISESSIKEDKMEQFTENISKPQVECAGPMSKIQNENSNSAVSQNVVQEANIDLLVGNIEKDTDGTKEEAQKEKKDTDRIETKKENLNTNESITDKVEENLEICANSVPALISKRSRSESKDRKEKSEDVPETGRVLRSATKKNKKEDTSKSVCEEEVICSDIAFDSTSAITSSPLDKNNSLEILRQDLNISNQSILNDTDHSVVSNVQSNSSNLKEIKSFTSRNRRRIVLSLID